ncbi:LysR substrate-binding domain-containing protein [Paenibacillus sp. WLX1005]|uniref:LysR family transcriptional regulator n=1 Tax=Paenibacillus sp. WLX1005 TaxID=3243766 RepID=UPI0039845A5D
MSLQRYRILQKVVHTGSLAIAARELQLTPSAISHAITSLEQELGLKLLLRKREHVQLTVEGELAWQHIRTILHEQQLLIQKVDSLRELETGILRIGTFSSVSMRWLPYMLAEFRQRYPQITIQLRDGSYDEITSWIAAGEIELGFISETHTAGLPFQLLYEDELFCLLPDGHPLSDEQELHAEQLRQERWILPVLGCDTGVRGFIAECDWKPYIAYELEDDHSMMAMVRQGHGITVLPELIMNPSDRQGMRLVRLSGRPCRRIGLTALNLNDLSPVACHFAACVMELLLSDVHT